MRLPSAHVARRLMLTVVTAPLLAEWPTMPVSAKPFLDSRFALEIPEGFVVSKRTAQTGTVFVAGNFPRFTVVSVTAWPLSTLLQDDAKSRALPGLPSSPVELKSGAKTLQGLGDAKEVAQLLLRARDREASSGALQSSLVRGDYVESRLEFAYTTESPVADPDALEKLKGVRQLIRRTAGASVLGSVPAVDGSRELAIFSVFASALEQDWEEVLIGCTPTLVSLPLLNSRPCAESRGPQDLQAPLERTVQSFRLAEAASARE